MCMDKDYQMIDHSIKINKEELPKLLQNIIKDLEKYDKEGNMEMYDGLYEGLESFSKSFLLTESKTVPVDFCLISFIEFNNI